MVLANGRALSGEICLEPLNPLDVDARHLLRNYRFPHREILRLCEELTKDIGMHK